MSIMVKCPHCGFEFVNELTCKRCGHKWVQREKDLPSVCPDCKSPYWNKDYVNGKKKAKK